MPPTPCQLCQSARALVKRPKTGQQVCKSCFFEVFETEVHNTIIEGEGVFKPGEKVAIGASGGKGGLDLMIMKFRSNNGLVSDILG